MKINNNYINHTPTFRANIENEQQIRTALNYLESGWHNELFMTPDKDKIKWGKQVAKLVNNKLEEIKKFANDNYSLRIGQLVESPTVTQITIKNKKTDWLIENGEAPSGIGTSNVAKQVVKEITPESNFFLLNGILSITQEKLEALKNWHNKFLKQEIESSYGKNFSEIIIKDVEKYL